MAIYGIVTQSYQQTARHKKADMKKWSRKIGHSWRRWRRVVYWWVAISLSLAIIAVCGQWEGWWRLEDFWSKLKEKWVLVAGLSNSLAFILALLSFYYSRTLMDAISTRFVGAFPAHLDEIADCVNNAKESVYALWDGVDPGSYFDPEAHERLLNTMQLVLRDHKRKPRVKVKFLIWGGPKAVSAAGGPETAVQKTERRKKFCDFWKKRKGFSGHLDELFRKIEAKQGISIDDVTKCLFDTGSRRTLQSQDETFDALQLCFHEWIRRQVVDAGACVRDAKPKNEAKQGEKPDESEKETKPEIFFWIIDGKKAVFTLISATENALAFSTQDPKLVDTLETTFETRWKEAGGANNDISTENEPAQAAT